MLITAISFCLCLIMQDTYLTPRHIDMQCMERKLKAFFYFFIRI